ncbi:MAG: hypothetical protein A2W91_16840 [Bacteroidetes bacterium GWF2_38_335]|nr:MAG: hypothetical protein A2W91_16840 [Bacteroidetes bacterium GWF2_38_335]OFY81442.1 MAG: hypothetical protein A2281_07815 [Bacteroidetes bacterium RIFOXYA12_FULL_38_20]HBS85474.1 hypothetical protein [Bacteroidales bacterium]
MLEPKMIHISEPKLSFGYNQKISDPRDGLTLFGPFSKKKISGQVNVGVIGPNSLRTKLIEFLKKIHSPVKSNKDDSARPDFPGLNATFGIHINFENLQQIEVPQDEINKYLNYSDNHQRVHNLTNLYSDKLIDYTNKEEIPVIVWFVIIPEDIFKFGRPNSRIPKSENNITLSLKKKDRDSQQLSMFFQEENDALREAYQFEVNFHNQLKAKLLADKIITQIIRDSKIDYENLWNNEEKIEQEKMFDSSKAWNIATTLYYKSGGLPWRLGEVRENVCYLGLVYKKLETDENNRNACCAAQMFLDSGDGMVFRGNIGPWYNPKTKEFHLSHNDAVEIINQSLEAFKNYSPTESYPKEVFIHAKTYFEDEEWSGFVEAAANKSEIVGVRIRDDRTFKMYRDYSYCIPRGSCLIFSSNKAYLWTRGFITRLQTQLGLETPNPLNIEITKGKSDIETVCKDILALTKLNYNTCSFADGAPVTLKFAESIGEVLTAGKNIQGNVLPFKHYI